MSNPCPGPVGRTLIIFSRDMRIYFGDWHNILFVVIMPFICAIILRVVSSSASFDNYRNGVPIVFSLSCAAMLIGLMLSVNMICKNRVVVRRDLRKGITAKVMIVSKTLLIFLCCLVMSVLLMNTYALSMGPYIYTEYNLMYLCAGLTATMFVASEMGLVISAFCRTPESAANAIPFIMLFQIIFSGILFDMDDKVSILGYFTISKYSTNILGSAFRFDRFAEVTSTYNYSADYALQQFIPLGIILVFCLVLSIGVLYSFDYYG